MRGSHLRSGADIEEVTEPGQIPGEEVATFVNGVFQSCEGMISRLGKK
jgi:hypothetical protein